MEEKRYQFTGTIESVSNRWVFLKNIKDSRGKVIAKNCSFQSRRIDKYGYLLSEQIKVGDILEFSAEVVYSEESSPDKYVVDSKTGEFKKTENRESKTQAKFKYILDVGVINESD